MPDQDFAKRAALRQARAQRLLGAARRAVCRRARADGGVRLRALRRAGARAADADPAPVPGPVDDRLRLDRARLAQRRAGLPAAVRRREGRHDRAAAGRRRRSRRAPRCCSPSITRTLPASPAPCRRSRSSCSRWGAPSAFDVFILSDTRGEAGRRARGGGLRRAQRAACGRSSPVYYRRRRENHGAQVGQYQGLGAPLRRAPTSTSSCSTATASCPARRSCAWRSPCSATRRRASSRPCRGWPAP